MARLAECCCGALSAHCTGDPTSVSLCHCTMCQRRTGSAFGIAAFFFKEKVKITGQSKTYRRPGESGCDVVFHFCPDCGSTVFWYPLSKPDKVAVGVGAFSDTRFPGPGKEVHTLNRLRWVKPLTSD
ncbi:GFA family protein [Roseibium sp.]|uniref:GFA family protein n=1 Tax=Roseibium sp. TaxID=1936156 RepID=UPI003BABC068